MNELARRWNRLPIHLTFSRILRGPIRFDHSDCLVLPFSIRRKVLDVLGREFLRGLLGGFAKRFELLRSDQDWNCVGGHPEQGSGFIGLNDSRKTDGHKKPSSFRGMNRPLAHATSSTLLIGIAPRLLPAT
jgi:hypothetical protein